MWWPLGPTPEGVVTGCEVSGCLEPAERQMPCGLALGRVQTLTYTCGPEAWGGAHRAEHPHLGWMWGGPRPATQGPTESHLGPENVLINLLLETSL